MSETPAAERERRARRSTFDTVANSYDRVRPKYHRAMLDDLVRWTGVGDGTRVLEIGPGTGRLTAALARRGAAVVAVELGPRLAAVARRRLARYPSVRVEVAAFEDWPLPTRPFDLVVAASSFHWLDPSVRLAKVADALRVGGAFALIDTHHIAGGTQRFFEDSQECYSRWDPHPRRGFRLPRTTDVPRASAELAGSPSFGRVRLGRYEWEASYTSPQYRELLRTYSDHRAMPPSSLRRLLDCLGRRVDSDYDGQIRKRHLTELRIVRKRAAPARRRLTRRVRSPAKRVPRRRSWSPVGTPSEGRGGPTPPAR